MTIPAILSHQQLKTVFKTLFILFECTREAVCVTSLDIFTITKYTGYDPEIGLYNYGGINIVGMDEGRYPSTRSYTLSLSLDF